MLLANIILYGIPLLIVLILIHIENRQYKKVLKRMNYLVKEVEIENKTKEWSKNENTTA